jgi:OOP family OmpA-OmpF porin
MGIALAAALAVLLFGYLTFFSSGREAPPDPQPEAASIQNRAPAPDPPPQPTQPAKTESERAEPAKSDEPQAPAPPPESDVKAAPPVPEAAVLPIRFAESSATPKVDSRALGRALSSWLQALRAQPGRLLLTGHASETGTELGNEKLGLLRAQSARTVLLERGAPDRIEVRSAGSTQPVAGNDTPEGRARNRRVTIEWLP